MNTLAGAFTTQAGPAIEVGESRFPVPPGLEQRLEEGRPVIVGARPEHLDVSPDGPVVQKVRAVEWLGHECLVFGSVGPSPVVVRQVGMTPHEAGGTIRLAVDPANVHVFDSDTSERLG
ncbi:MAG TPA: TOBE domain-containing protein, partial [Acidimicrobiales bacterium]|nr:TOBE domain-containing protein [Acidimicrobiales bacterium]